MWITTLVVYNVELDQCPIDSMLICYAVFRMLGASIEVSLDRVRLYVP